MQQFSFLAAIWVIITLACTLLLALDLRRNRQKMAIMEPVWVLTTLWAGAFGLWAYYWFGREAKQQIIAEGDMVMEREDMRAMDNMAGMSNMKMEKMKMGDMADMDMMDKDMMAKMDMAPTRPKWQSIVLSTLHCGAGCTLADIIGVIVMAIVPLTICGSLIFGSWGLDYILALIIGIGFQYAAIRAMERVSTRRAIWRAAKADFFSLTAWQIGMYAWIGLLAFGVNSSNLPPANTIVFWFMMQIAMACGFIVALPVNALLIRVGIKRAM